MSTIQNYQIIKMQTWSHPSIQKSKEIQKLKIQSRSVCHFPKATPNDFFGDKNDFSHQPGKDENNTKRQF